MIQKANQKISVPLIFNKEFRDKPFSIKVKRTAGNGKLSFYSSNKKVAMVDRKGKVTVKGMGEAKITVSVAENQNYKGKKIEVMIRVCPVKPKISSIKSLKGRKAIVNWKKDKSGTGYQIEYATNKKFKKGVKKAIINKSRATSYTLRKLKIKKKYYVRMRTYKTVKGKKYYSKWSKVKNVTVKK